MYLSIYTYIRLISIYTYIYIYTCAIYSYTYIYIYIAEAGRVRSSAKKGNGQLRRAYSSSRRPDVGWGALLHDMAREQWLRSVLIISVCINSNSGSQIPEPLLMFTSTCPLKVQIPQGLGPFVQIEFLQTGRREVDHPDRARLRAMARDMVEYNPDSPDPDPYMYTSGVFLGKLSVDPKLHTEVNILFSKVFFETLFARFSIFFLARCWYLSHFHHCLFKTCFCYRFSVFEFGFWAWGSAPLLIVSHFFYIKFNPP